LPECDILRLKSSERIILYCLENLTMLNDKGKEFLDLLVAKNIIPAEKEAEITEYLAGADRTLEDVLLEEKFWIRNRLSLSKPKWPA